MINLGDIDAVNVTSKDKDLNLVRKGNTNSFEYNDEQKLEEVNNVQAVMTNLDRDVVVDDNLTTIDFNTRLGETEIAPIVALQLLHSLNVGGSSCSLITRSIKRHKVSLRGLGRTEKVQIMQGEREHETGGNSSSLFGKIKGFMGGSKNDENK